MDLHHLMTVFVAVVDCNGFAGAARRLSMSPPAVTRAINDLESQIGARLLARTTRVVRVTDAGGRYADDCRRILQDVVTAHESVSGAHGKPKGRLTVTAPALFGTLFMTPIVTEYLAAYPEVNVSCWFLDRVVNMVEEGVDVGVRIGELPDSSMQAIKVGEIRRVICAAPSYLKEFGTPHSPEDLQERTIVSASAVTPRPEWGLVENGVPRAVRLRARLMTTTNDSAVNAALTGFGLTRLLSYQVDTYLRSGALVTVLDEFEPEPVPLHVVHREGRFASPKSRIFIDLAVGKLRENLAFKSGRNR